MAETKSQPVAAARRGPWAALPPYGCGVPFTGGERHWQLQIPAHSADSTRYCRGADSRVRRKTPGWYRLALKRLQPPGLSLRGGRRPTWQSREGSYVFAGSTQLSGQVLRDSHVASLLGM